jgi:predicted secreted Zn-dependent protease
MKEDEWVRSSECDAGSCVEVLVDDNLIFVRSSEAGQLGPAAQFFTVLEWRAFIAGVKAGEFDV